MGSQWLLPLAMLFFHASGPTPLFTNDERAAIIAYWSKLGRYQVEPPPLGQTSGQWVVRLTPEASIWLYNYNKTRGAGNVPPTQVAPPQPGRATEWDTWVNTKLAYDQWVAQSAADPSVRPMPPGLPAPIPDDLLAAAGNPPPLAAVVAPLHYVVTFDDGETIAYDDHVPVPARYAYYRFAQGVQYNGTPVRSIPDSELNPLFRDAGMSAFQSHVVKAVSRLEGGFESVNTYDTGYLSVGFIQCATLAGGGGSLGEVLRWEKAERPKEFNHDFRRLGIDVTDSGLLAAIDPETGAELVGPQAVQKIIDDKRLTAVFQRAGEQSSAFRVAQIAVARDRFYPAGDAFTITVSGQTLHGRVADVIHSEAGMATLFDRKINTGSLGPFEQVVTQVMQEHNITTLQDAANYEKEIVGKMKYRADFLADTSLGQPADPRPIVHTQPAPTPPAVLPFGGFLPLPIE